MCVDRVVGGHKGLSHCRAASTWEHGESVCQGRDKDERGIGNENMDLLYRLVVPADVEPAQARERQQGLHGQTVERHVRELQGGEAARVRGLQHARASALGVRACMQRRHGPHV